MPKFALFGGSPWWCIKCTLHDPNVWSVYLNNRLALRGSIDTRYRCIAAGCRRKSDYSGIWLSLIVRYVSIFMEIVKRGVRNEDEITFPSRRMDLGQICSISNHKSWRNSKLFWCFWDLRSGKGGLKLWCIVAEVISSSFLSMIGTIQERVKKKKPRLNAGKNAPERKSSNYRW